MTPDQFDPATFGRVLGDEMRKARKRCDLFRREVPPRMSRQVSEQTVATYELGTRHVSVVNFVDYCLAVDTSPVEVLRDTYRRVVDRSQPDGWDVDITVAARLHDPELAPLACWARSCLANPDHPRMVHLSRAAVQSLAALCGLDWFRLVGRLPAAPNLDLRLTDRELPQVDECEDLSRVQEL